MAVIQRILIFICMAVAVSSARIESSKRDNNIFKSPRIEEEPYKPTCPASDVGKSIFHPYPYKLCICIGVGNSIELGCEEGKGFNGVECVPWDEYPCKGGLEPACEGPQLTRPHQHQDPRKFYVCRGEGVAEVYPCPDGSGFMDAPGDVGCVPWARWRCLKKD